MHFAMFLPRYEKHSLHVCSFSALHSHQAALPAHMSQCAIVNGRWSGLMADGRERRRKNLHKFSVFKAIEEQHCVAIKLLKGDTRHKNGK